MRILSRTLILVLTFTVSAPMARSADWLQLMRTSMHTGDAAGESLQLPLGLAICVRLGDAITTGPAVVGGKIYVVDQMGTAYCVDPSAVSYSHNPALGQDYFVTRSYGGHGILRDLASGKPIVRNGKEALGGCPDHSCSPVLLTTGRISCAVSSSELYARDVDSGKILWQSLGFAPRACTTPIAAHGRLFFSPNVNNALYCFEPVP